MISPGFGVGSVRGLLYAADEEHPRGWRSEPGNQPTDYSCRSESGTGHVRGSIEHLLRLTSPPPPLWNRQRRRSHPHQPERAPVPYSHPAQLPRECANSK